MKKLTIQDIKKFIDKGYEKGKAIRERAADDLVFYWVTQWDDNFLDESTLGYKGEFNILRKAGRQITTDLRLNPVQVDFEPKYDDIEDDDELMDGLYRTVDREVGSFEAYANANSESVVCGYGAWELHAEYESDEIGDDKQTIHRRPLYEANNNVIWDPSAKAIDKSDANWCAVLECFSKDGMKKVAKDLTGEAEDGDVSTMRSPEHSYTFPWISGESVKFWLVRFYHRVEEKDSVVTVTDFTGNEMLLYRSQVEEVMDDLIDNGYEIVSEKEVKRHRVYMYQANGHRILQDDRIPGAHIPVVPQYGERAFIEGEEQYEGVTKLAKDPSRLRNFIYSYFGDITSRTPREKPIFWADQVAGYQDMYEDNGADNNYPYYLMNRFDSKGKELPIGSVANMPSPQIPQALQYLAEFTRDAVGDVAAANVPQDIADIDLSGKALGNLQNRLDEQSAIYQLNRKMAVRRDGEIFASMSKEVYDTPRKVTITGQDGKRKTVQLMEVVLDKKTGENVVLRDLTNSAYDVYADIGKSYTNRREETIDQLDNMLERAQTIDPAIAQLLLTKQVQLFDGVDMENVRTYARKQELLRGYRDPDPESEEDMRWLQEAAQQGQQPDANMVLAQAEQAKAEAMMTREENNRMKIAADAQNKDKKTDVDAYNAQTKRAQVEIEAEKAGADIDYKSVQSYGAHLENMAKASALRVRVNP